MYRIPCLRITSSKIWKSTSRCRHQKGRWIGLLCFPLFDRKPSAQRKRNFQNWLWKRFQLDKPAIHAKECFRNTPWSLSTHTRRTVSLVFFLGWFTNQILWSDPARRSWVSRFNFGFHSGSDWQFRVEKKLMVPWRWKFKWLLQNQFERSQKNEAEKTLGLKINPRNANCFPWWHYWKTTIDDLSIFPKTLPRD